MNAHAKDTALATAILDRFDPKREHRSTFDLMEAARTLRRAQLTLHRWAEEECNGTIQRDADSFALCSQCGHTEYSEAAAQPGAPCAKCGDPAPIRHVATNKPARHAPGYNTIHGWTTPPPVGIPDREAGALRRVAEVCKAAGLHYYHQTDPRGCALYVSTEPLTSSNYNRGIACL